MMRFYNQAHRFYAGVDLHARTLAVCILDQAGAFILEGRRKARMLFWALAKCRQLPAVSPGIDPE